MKKIILQKLYNVSLSLSYYFDNKWLVKCKIFLGTSLLMLINSCGADLKTEEPEIACYLWVENTDTQDSTSHEEPEVIYCYVSMPEEEPSEQQDATEKTESDSSSTDTATETTENQ